MRRVLLLASVALMGAAACESSKPEPEKSAFGPASSAVVAAPSPSPSTSASAAEAPSASAHEEPKIIGAAQILVAYKGAEGAPKTITRSKDEARKRAEQALAKLKGGAPFEDVVKQYSDDPITKATHGQIGNFERNVMPAAFSDVAFALEVDQISGVIDAPRGFFIVKRTK